MFFHPFHKELPFTKSMLGVQRGGSKYYGSLGISILTRWNTAIGQVARFTLYGICFSSKSIQTCCVVRNLMGCWLQVNFGLIMGRTPSLSPLYIYIHMYVCMYVRMDGCMHACMHVCMYVCVRLYVCMYVGRYVCMYVCVWYVYIYIYDMYIYIYDMYIYIWYVYIYIHIW